MKCFRWNLLIFCFSACLIADISSAAKLLVVNPSPRFEFQKFKPLEGEIAAENLKEVETFSRDEKIIRENLPLNQTAFSCLASSGEKVVSIVFDKINIASCKHENLFRSKEHILSAGGQSILHLTHTGFYTKSISIDSLLGSARHSLRRKLKPSHEVWL